jgi:uncharacterized protein YndB with AHSA1/START domain
VSADAELTTARVQRLLPVSPADAYDAWVDADRLRRFICPEPGTAEVAIDPRPGGSLRIVMAFPDRARVIEGEYLALERPHRLTFSWRPQWREPESVVTVSFDRSRCPTISAAGRACARSSGARLAPDPRPAS